MAEYTFENVQSDHTIDVVFKAVAAPMFVITAFAGEHGSISPSGPVPVAAGAAQTFVITADEGYEVDKVFIDGAEITL